MAAAELSTGSSSAGDGSSPSLPPPVQSPLTVIVRVIPDRLEDLRAVLRGVRERIASGGPTALKDIGTVHFARWVILDNLGDTPYLLFASSFDGESVEYIIRFAADAPDTFDAIYRNCEEYPAGGARDADAFLQYVRDHEVTSEVFFSAYPDYTVEEVHRALGVSAQLREIIEAVLA